MKSQAMSVFCLTVALVGVASARPEQAWRAGSDAEAAAANAAAGQHDSPPPQRAPQRGPQPAQQPPQQPAQQPPQQPPQYAPRPIPQRSAAPPPAPPPAQPAAAQPPRFGVSPGAPRGDSDPARGRWSSGGQPPGAAPRQDLRRDDGRLDQARREEAWRAQQAQRNGDRRDGDRRADEPRGGYRPGQPGWTGGRGAPAAHRDYSWRDYDRYRAQNFRFDGGRYIGRSRYRMGDYYWPRGYSNDIWLIGAWLPAAFFLDTRYQLVEYWRFGLYEPPFGTHWIRVGADALLVDDFNGEVLDAIYDLFW